MVQLDSDYDLKDIGEVVEMVRVRKYKKNEEAFAEMIGISLKTLRCVEQGKSSHGFFVLKKMQELKMLKAGISYEI